MDPVPPPDQAEISARCSESLTRIIKLASDLGEDDFPRALAKMFVESIDPNSAELRSSARVLSSLESKVKEVPELDILRTLEGKHPELSREFLFMQVSLGLLDQVAEYPLADVPDCLVEAILDAGLPDSSLSQSHLPDSGRLDWLRDCIRKPHPQGDDG